MKLIRSIAVLLAILIATVSIANAQSQPVVTVSDLNYIVGQVKPFNYKEGGTLRGMAIDLMALVWKELGITPKSIKQLPWARAIVTAEKRKNTVLFVTARTKSRADRFKWACPIFEIRTILLAKKHPRVKIKSITDLNKYKVGTVRKNAVESTLLSKGVKSSSIIASTKRDLCIKQLAAGRVDMVAFSELGIYKAILDLDMVRADYEVAYVVGRMPLCFAFNKQVPDSLIVEFREALSKVVTQPSYQAILRKYNLI